MKIKSQITENFFIKEIKNSSINLNPKIFDKKNILITGASGLLGTYFIAFFSFLITVGIKLNLYACSKNQLPRHLLDFISLKGIHHIKIDLTKPDEYIKIPDNLDYIIHAAGYAQPSVFMKNPEETLLVNILGASFLFNKLKTKGSFLFLSSSEVYAGIYDKKCNENMIGYSNTLHERACYIEGKKSTETLCHAYRKLGYRSSVARLGDIFGPGTRAKDKRAINSFIEQAIKKKKISLKDRGTAIRSYCYILDALDILLKILTKSKDTIYNVGNSKFISIKNMAELIALATNSNLHIPKTSNSIKGAPRVIKIELSKIKQEFGDKKYLSIKQGLQRTIDWQRENLYRKNK